jgi:microcystin-dependent protein
MLLDELRGRQVVASLMNGTGVGVVLGDVVILDSAGASGFTGTIVEGQTDDWVGVVLETIGAGAIGRVCLSGYVPQVNLDGAAGLGDYIMTSAVSLQATPVAARAPGCFGQVLDVGTTPPAVLWGNLDGVLADHLHLGVAGDGGAFDAGNLTSGAAVAGTVLTSNGAGAANWAAPGAAVIGAHAHAGVAGDGGTFDGTNLTSGEAAASTVLMADGAGAANWTAIGAIVLANHDHSGDPGDGDQFDAAHLLSGTAPLGDVLTSNGGAGASWQPAIPAGAIIMWGGAVAPTGWLVCDYALYHAVDYPALYAVIGTDFDPTVAAGDFRVPPSGGNAPEGVTGFTAIGALLGAGTHTHAAHAAVAHFGADVSAHAGADVSAHAGTAVADHAAWSHTAGGAHTHDVHTRGGVASVGVGYLTGPTTHLSEGGHNHDSHPVKPHTVTQANAHTITQADDHTITQASDHPAESHDVVSSRGPRLVVNFIIKT